MITIHLNSEKIAYTHKVTLLELLDGKGYKTGCFAIAVNRQFVPRGQYEITQLQDGDQIDVVTPMQGG